MKGILKKIVIFSTIALMQIGLATAVIEASPRHHDEQQQEWRYEHRDHDREHRIREEQARYERERQRRHHESEREYRERQEREREHHEEIMRALGALAIIAIIANNS